MLENITQRFGALVKTLRGQARLNEENITDALREVRMALLEADVALPVVKQFIDAVKPQLVGQQVLQSLTPGQAAIGLIHHELTRLMGDANVPINLATNPPAVILLAGLQGVGKTTTAAKLALHLRQTLKKKVFLVSTDVHRPAAITQLKTLGKQLNIDTFDSDTTQKPQQIAEHALDFARRHFYDVVIFDTAGRLAIDEALMAEITELEKITQPIETLLVIDAMQGQDAIKTAQAFHQQLKLTGLILTKLDGDSRGGAALSARAITGVPIKFVGVSEKPDGIQAFHPDRMASRILGMGDVLSLIEEAQRHTDIDQAKKLAHKVQKGKGFDLEDFLNQIQQMKKMGGIQGLMDKLPGQLAQMAQKQDNPEKNIKATEAIIYSMTPKERRNPDLLKASRKRRIAAGSGTTVQEVNRLLNQFEQMQKMMKMMKGMMPGM